MCQLETARHFRNSFVFSSSRLKKEPVELTYETKPEQQIRSVSVHALYNYLTLFVCDYLGLLLNFIMTPCCDFVNITKQVRVMKTPYTPLLYSKTGDYRGIFYLLIFALKHKLWVLVRTASVSFLQQ